LSKGFLEKTLLPDLDELGFRMVLLEHEVFDHLAEDKQLEQTRCTPHTVLSLSSNREKASLSIFTSYAEHLDSEDNQKGNNTESVQLQLDKTLCMKLDFERLVRSFLEK
jgi:hypothetical protein